MVRRWAAAHDTHWLGRYRELRTTYDRDLVGDQQRAHAASTAYYRKHRRAMDAGCEVSWKHCFDAEHDFSAVQHAYNILIDEGEDIFDAECQVNPKRADRGLPGSLTAADLQKKINRVARRMVLFGCDVLTAAIDVQQAKLYPMACGWGPGFSAAFSTTVPGPTS